MSGHTPGPWLYRPQKFDDWGMVRAAENSEGRQWVICQARAPFVSEEDMVQHRIDGTDPYEANARLIAAAPELLDALVCFIGEADAGHVTVKTDRRARAAIAKAKGEPLPA